MHLDLDVTWEFREPFQVHRVTSNTVILRQSISANFEAPFLYLLFGRDRALLLDTGATADSPLREIVDGLLAPLGPGYELVVGHSHSHADHIAGDAQFADRSRITLADLELVDLGDRLLRVLQIPGHHPSSVAVYDESTGLLFTGDTVYPGRLYVDDFPSFAASIRQLCDFADTHPVAAILGAHIEMSTTPGRDFPVGALAHPNEAALPMTVTQLHAIRDALADAEAPGRHQFDDFAIWTE